MIIVIKIIIKILTNMHSLAAVAEQLIQKPLTAVMLQTNDAYRQ